MKSRGTTLVQAWLAKTPMAQRIERFTGFCRNRQKAHSNCNAKPILNGPALAGWENIPRLRGFEHTAHSPRPFPPAFPGSNSGASARRQCFCQTGFAGDNFCACASALSNRLAKPVFSTRGFTSCIDFVKVASCISIRNRFVACIRIRIIYKQAGANIKKTLYEGVQSGKSVFAQHHCHIGPRPAGGGGSFLAGQSVGAKLAPAGADHHASGEQLVYHHYN